jgi:hypothetical protein
MSGRKRKRKELYLHILNRIGESHAALLEANAEAVV